MATLTWGDALIGYTGKKPTPKADPVSPYARAANHKTRWDEDDLVKLLAAWSEDKDLLSICIRVERTATSVCSKLADLRILRIDTQDYTYYHRKTDTVYANRIEIRKMDEYMKTIPPDAPWAAFF